MEEVGCSQRRLLKYAQKLGANQNSTSQAANQIAFEFDLKSTSNSSTTETTSSSVMDYLQKHYLTADKPKKSKKRKREGGTTIIDDDDTLSLRTKKTTQYDGDGPIIVGEVTATKKKGRWKKVGSAADAEEKAADAIIEAAARERAAEAAAEDDAPVIEDIDEPDTEALVGLRTGEEVTAHLKKKAALERKKFEEEAAAGVGGKGETVYRDATGRRIDVEMKKAEARRKAEEEAKRKKEEAEAARGDVQRAMKETQRERLKDAKSMTVARYKDDVEMNEELKQTERWNDPATAFITKKMKGKSVTGRPLYQGSFEQNRYGIRPGHRWDGVDRGNGFEKKWWDARNRKRDRQNLEYAWEMDE